jgi:nucleoid-associated protein YgaU
LPIPPHVGSPTDGKNRSDPGIASSGIIAGSDTSQIFRPDPAPVLLEIEDESGQTVTHRVRKGDTLWDISKRYTGSGFNYPAVAEDNQINNPHLIYPKQKIEVR